ncbi:MAG: transcription-repair coupling factor [Anaerolineae bacterium]
MQLQLHGLLSLLSESSSFAGLVNAITSSKPTPDQHLLRSARPFVVAALAQQLKRPVLVVTGSVERAYNITEQLPAWLPDTPVLRFAEPSALFYERSPWAQNAIRSRLDALASLSPAVGMSASDLTPPVIVTSALALMQRTLPVREFKAASRVLKLRQPADPDKLLRTWLGIGYEPASVVVEPGTFSRRGGIIDVYPINALRPVRMEFWGDEIESIRTFDPHTQRSADNLQQMVVVPARESLPKLARPVAERLSNWFSILPPGDEDLTSAAPDEAELYAESAFPMLEFYLPYFYSQPVSLIDYLPSDSLVVVEDWQGVAAALEELETQAVSQREEKLSLGQIPADYPLPYFTWEELRDQLRDHMPLHLAAPTGEESEDGDIFAGDPLSLGRLFAPGNRYGGQLKAFLDGLRDFYSADNRAIVVSNQAQRLAELWTDNGGGAITPVSQIDDGVSGITFVEGAMAEGWTFKPEEHPPLHLFTDAEIFGWKRPEPRRHLTPRAVSPEAYFADMVEGDYIVHVEYGIGRFAGMIKRTLDKSEREYLVIQFAGNDTLYVPIHQADRLTKFVGVEGQEPALSKLGSTEWLRAKENARANAEEVARDLLELYASRASVSGFAFPPDVPWQAELEASFPFIETEDQLRVLREVKADMERSQPMDRLICGDVGYGKTEIALRAAFKAVMAGKQVAILVPTTVLAQQHYNTFSQRMAAFPVKVEMLSRFRSHKEQKEIIDAAAAGAIDILIGTHRLLQEDVKFRDLGLLVVDEEQRFGVTHKERLKRMRTEVDILTMTATPIPRTLYMSLAGVRDISLLQTPPEERLPVLTHVGAYDDKMIRQAILREIDRDGQIYFLHNRVSTIDSMEHKLSELVPEARIIIGHGQMPEDELERVMTDFASGSYHVLLCTTIIESGLDIPNANTLIVDHADMFGLAQLYQLRGRVGRSVNQAYAYLFYPRHAHLTPEAKARLDTIAEQTDLGSGMNIAMRDLEIRGTGDLLGLRQSGYINSVGIHLYTQMLSQAVGKLKAGKKLEAEDAKAATVAAPILTIDLPVPAFIPVEFIPEMQMRLQLYRRIADINSVQALDEITAELTDRFGALPPEMLGLLFQVRVKLLAAAANVSAISFNEGQISIRLPYLAEVDRGGLQRYLENNVRVSRTAVWLPRESDDWQTHLLDVLDRLDMRETESAQS